MKWLIYIFALAIFCTACDTKTSSSSSTGTSEAKSDSSPGATSIAGITPGKTTFEELKNLVTNPEKLNLITEPGRLNNVNFHIVELKALNGEGAHLFSNNGVVYQVVLTISDYSEIGVALTEKYGAPKTKKGGLKEVTCQNGYGASFKRLEGTEDLLWKPNDGIQAYFRRWARDCKDIVFQTYTIEHVATVQMLKAIADAESAKTMSNTVDKLKAGL